MLSVNDELLDQALYKYYNLNNDKQYIFNYSNKILIQEIKVKDNIFNGATHIIKVNKSNKNDFIENDLGKEDILYIRVEDKIFANKLEKLNYRCIFPISKVQIKIKIEKIN